MNSNQLIRAWRDPVYRATLDRDALSALRHPAGDASDRTFLFGEADNGDEERITGTAGCGTPGCTQIVCTDPCGTIGCNTTDKPGCTLGTGCEAPPPEKTTS
jgi:mersacidin/lichenicidin family type 2 lantibiotic